MPSNPVSRLMKLRRIHLRAFRTLLFLSTARPFGISYIRQSHFSKNVAQHMVRARLTTSIKARRSHLEHLILTLTAHSPSRLGRVGHGGHP
ncbi:hypothetical protein DFH11DRAFT_1563589 [Phellopilus nigrolimitatus]|nr:hypothetical protein DFH11DRAFT_1563589 [Phellopilus nigrolimitatus]